MQSEIRKIDTLFQNTCSSNTPGVALVIKQQDRPLFKSAYGVCDLVTREKITADTCFNIASLTKQFTAFGILQLENEKQLSIEQTLEDFFPGYSRPCGNTVTVRHLLSHCSGLHDHYSYISTGTTKHITDSHVLEAMQKIGDLYFVPGSQYRYSNTAYCLLAKILEKTSGLDYNDFLQRHIFAPLGMHSSFCWNNQTGDEKKIATGYDKNALPQSFSSSGADQHPFFSTEGDGGIYTTINDYMQWMGSLQQPGVFSQKLIDKVKTPLFAIDGKARLFYGAGWFIDHHAPVKMYHCGSNGGYRSYSYSIPGAGYWIALFANRSDLPLEKLTFNITEWLVPEHQSFIPIETLTS